MSTDILPTRAAATVEEPTRSSFTLAVALHLAVIGGIAGSAWLAERVHPHWGDRDPVAGAIQASMVNALPLPPRQRTVDNAVLTSEKPSIAPTPPPPAPEAKAKVDPVKPKAEPPPKPNEVLIPKKADTSKPPLKVAERETPTPPKRALAAPPPPTTKATTGETAGVQIPQSITQLKNGTASLTIENRSFGDRYAYYIRLVAQKIDQSKQEGGLDPTDAKGKHAEIHFFIERDGTPTDIEVVTRSGSAALDLSTLRAIQRIDTFGPLPQGDRQPFKFIYDAK